jgi:hypothetical protein
MGELIELRFCRDEADKSLLPERCTITADCYNAEEILQAVAASTEQILIALGMIGIDLRLLDGVTFAKDCEAAANALQVLPEGQIPLEMGEQPETMELGRTITVRRNREIRFHIVARAGVGLMALSPENDQQRLALACIAHEAAHVDHEGHLSRTFPHLYEGPLDCGDRSKQTFIKAMDVWSEYAACRSSALFRPEAIAEYEQLFCRALENGIVACKERIAAYRSDHKAVQVFVDIQQIFGDVFICAGYFLGHLDGLELDLHKDAQVASELLRGHPQMEGLILRLGGSLRELWLTEYAWESVEVFASVYDLIREMMALHGLVFARREEEWRIVLCEDEDATTGIRSALDAWMKKPGEFSRE